MICVGASAVPSAVSIAVFSSAAVVTSVLLLTVTRQVADFSRAVAVMVAVPSATAVTSPSLLTVATEVFVTAPYYGFGSHPVGDNGGNQRFGRSRFQGQSLMIEGDALYGHGVVVIVVVATGGCQRCCHKAEEKDS